MKVKCYNCNLEFELEQLKPIDKFIHTGKCDLCGYRYMVFK